jgi:hypothetical protein
MVKELLRLHSAHQRRGPRSEPRSLPDLATTLPVDLYIPQRLPRPGAAA